jgi:protein-disulfide isomerase
MTLRPLALLLSLALAPAGLLVPARPLAASKPDPAKAAEDLDVLLDELALPGIGFNQRQLLARFAAGDFCYCGCPHTVASCLLSHKPCKHSARMVRLAAGVIAQKPDATVAFIKGFVDQYYASFDRRAKLDVTAFGPALGDEKAPVTIVEFSDFTCPHCQAVRPVLEAFVADHPGRVKLHFKPFPIQTHPGAVEAAIAGEWGRDQGAFWKLHDALFSASGLDLDGLAAAAEAAGLDASELRDAVTSRKQESRVMASQSEGFKAGVRATPTLFVNGRKVELPEINAAWLEFTLEDEEEWLRNKGSWAKD